VHTIMTDILQIIGAVLILSGFAASQLGWMDAKSVTYLVLNIVGAALLTWLALHDGDWGFFLLEGVWTVVSLIALVDVLRRRGRIAKASRVTTASPSPGRRSTPAAAESPESPPH